MEIKWTWFGKYFSFSIGHDTPWFSQMPLIILIEEIYVPDNREIQYAKIIFKWL